ncbi:KIN17-like protein [Triticum dicoccoides]|uniref:KIN17-like protein n=1 Tax=Triticum dicoccoides TaxID=85692 RepID=UPI000E7C8062|nr:KIN17-like protein [Triticum dicoccoides]
MGKSELKAMANRAKAKGLQKLRWYCQMCEKQCRDENGFKCHCSSESHQRQMAVFGQAPDRAVDRFSGKFLDAFLALLRHGHRGSRVAATVVYNELVADRRHVHMNSTRWATLSEFVEFLGGEGLAKVEHTPKGWFIAYIDGDCEQAVKAGLKRKRVLSEELVIARQIERAQKSMAKANGDDNGDLGKSEDEYSGSGDADQERQGQRQEDAKEINKATGKVAIALRRAAPAMPEVKPEMKFGLDEEEEEATNKGRDAGKAKDTRRSAIDDLMEEEKAKERSNRKDYWLCPGIVVKVMSKSLAEKGHHYYKHKGLVKRVIDRYVGEIEMLESKHVVRVDQDELETVIPQIGRLVRVVNGAYRGSNARLLSVDTERFSARLQVEKGLYDGRILEAVEYEDICKVA